MGCALALTEGFPFCASGVSLASAESAVRVSHYGVSTFPYGPSSGAADQAFRLAADLGDLYVVQLDNGVPWTEAAADTRFPELVERKWYDISAHAPPGRPLYLALEPLAEDRVSLAPSSEGSSSFGQSSSSFDNPSIVKAYIVYAQRAVRFFKPTYLNLGVESGELAYRHPSEWNAYVTLIRSVMTALRPEFPTLKIGISFGLQSLMDPATAKRAQQIIDLSDYVGLSFYPYMSPFQEKFGLPALPSPPNQWRVPLDWVRTFTSKPIAICETGYNTQGVNLPKWGIEMTGTEAAQKDYLLDLARYAQHDGYLFVIYYLSVDIGAILDTLPESQRAAANMWRHNGLLDGDLTPKPALDVWKSIVATRYEPAAASVSPQTVDGAPKAEARSDPEVFFGFERNQDLCQSPLPSQVDLVDIGSGKKALQWEFSAGTKAWSWCARPVPTSAFQSTTGTRFRIRSNVAGPVFLEMKGVHGEAYFSIMNVGPNWQDVVLNWSDFAAEPNNPGSGTLDPDKIISVVLADEGKEGTSPSQTRQIWVADWIVK